MSQEPETLVLELLRKIRADVARVDEKVDAAKADLHSDMHSLRADIAADAVAVNARIDAARKDTSDQIVGLRRAVIEYHSAVLGHRVAQHLGLRLSTRLARG